MCAALLMVITGPVGAEIYKWVDQDGNVHFSDSPPVQEEHEQVEVREDVSRQSRRTDVAGDSDGDGTNLAQRCNSAGRNLKRLGPQLQSMALSGAREANASASEIAELQRGFAELNNTSVAEFSRECRREYHSDPQAKALVDCFAEADEVMTAALCMAFSEVDI